MKTDMLANILTDVRLAFALLTRLPQPRLPDEAFERSSQAVWAYPLVGTVLGGIAVVVGMSAMAVGLPASLAAGVVLSVLVMTSGALHEDGLADVADGFWGGQTPERRLEIMKDSQIGTFGTLALVLNTGLRWLAISALLTLAPVAIILCSATSRAAMPLLMRGLPHARDTGLSHSVGRPGLPLALGGLGLVLILNLTFMGNIGAVPLLVAVVVAGFMKILARRKINGQTGDVLGATQQVSETAMLCILLAALA